VWQALQRRQVYQRLVVVGWLVPLALRVVRIAPVPSFGTVVPFHLFFFAQGLRQPEAFNTMLLVAHGRDHCRQLRLRHVHPKAANYAQPIAPRQTKHGVRVELVSIVVVIGVIQVIKRVPPPRGAFGRPTPIVVRSDWLVIVARLRLPRVRIRIREVVIHAEQHSLPPGRARQLGYEPRDGREPHHRSRVEMLGDSGEQSVWQAEKKATAIVLLRFLPLELARAAASSWPHACSFVRFQHGARAPQPGPLSTEAPTPAIRLTTRLQRRLSRTTQ